MFLFRFSGWFLFRFAARRFLGSLLKEPPRKTRSQAELRSDRPLRFLARVRLAVTGRSCIRHDGPSARSQPPSCRPIASVDV